MLIICLKYFLLLSRLKTFSFLIFCENYYSIQKCWVSNVTKYFYFEYMFCCCCCFICIFYSNNTKYKRRKKKESQVLQKYVSSSITVIFKCIIFPKIFVFKQIDASLLTIRDFYQKHEFLNMPSFWHLFGRRGCRVDEKKSQKAEKRLQLA